jgi:uncharacterized protein (DUF1330 family)
LSSILARRQIHQGVAKTYWIATYRSISNPDKLAAYAKLARPAITTGGGTFLVRGTPTKMYEAGLNQRTVVVAFESLEQAFAAHDSPAYQVALDALGDGAERDIKLVEGCNYPVIYSHLNPSPHRLTYPRDGDGK